MGDVDRQPVAPRAAAAPRVVVDRAGRRFVDQAVIHQLAQVPVKRAGLQLDAALGPLPHCLDDAVAVQIARGLFQLVTTNTGCTQARQPPES